MKELPPELWAQIARQLPPKHLIALMGFNRVFLELALEDCYKAFLLPPISRPVQERLDLLSNDDTLAQRVRTIVVRPLVADSSHKWLDLQSTRLRLIAPHAFLCKKLTGRAFPTRRGLKCAFDIIMGLLNEVLPRFKNVDALLIVQEKCQIPRPGKEEPDLPLPQIPWDVYSINLQRLEVVMPLQPTTTSCLPFGVDLPKLTVFKFHVRCRDACRTSGPKSMPESIGPLINQFQQSLKVLRVFWDCWSVNMDALFNQLGRFPHLTSLEACSSFRALTFIKQHADLLKELSYITDGRQSSETFGDIQFDRLETLSLSFWCTGCTWWTNPTPMLTSTLSTLRILHIHAFLDSSATLDKFLMTAARIAETEGRENPLQHLCIIVLNISPITLSSIARAFPKLRSLMIKIVSIAHFDNKCSVEAETYPYTMAHPDEEFIEKDQEAFTNLPSWGLEDVRIQRIGLGEPIAHWGLMSLLSKWAPNIRDFNFSGHRDFPSFGESRWCQNRLDGP